MSSETIYAISGAFIVIVVALGLWSDQIIAIIKAFKDK